MATSIAFNDGTGPAVLTNSKPTPADRFTAWNPEGGAVGPREHALADGAPYVYAFRVQYLTSFEVVGIPNEDMSIMLRLQRWLRGGGSVTINTGDIGTRTYTATLAPDGDVTIERTDPVHIEYTMTFTKLRNTASADMLCVYS